MIDIAIKFEQVSKYYKLYDSPKDRFKEALDPFRRRRYREFFALKNIDLEIKKGEILGVVGRNGSGKSTLLKLIAGVIPPSSGGLTVNGNISAMLELGSGLNPELGGIQNIYFGGIMMGISPEEMEAKVDEIVAFADIGDFINQPLKTYSSGMKARLGFALAISMKPDILVVDEVLSVGDDLFQRKCYAKIEELFKSGCTVFFVSHSIPSVVDICTRAILLDKGELILEGHPALVTTYYRKLLYALPARQDETRDEIIRLNHDQEEKKKYLIRDTEEKNKQENKPAEVISTFTEIKEDSSRPSAFFIPDFTPKTTVKNEFFEAKIFDYQIQTLSGQIVNALVMNEEYTISYKVNFNRDAENIRFATSVQSVKGLTISAFWIDTEPSRKIKKTDTYFMQNRFKCTLLPGNYYVTITVSKIDENNKKVRLYEVNDALVFKVLPEKKKSHWGLVNLGQTGQIQKIN